MVVRRDRLGKRHRHPHALQVPVDVGAHVDGAAIDQLHQGRRRERLGDRPNPEDGRVRIDRLTGLEIGDAVAPLEEDPAALDHDNRGTWDVPARHARHDHRVDDLLQGRWAHDRMLVVGLRRSEAEARAEGRQARETTRVKHCESARDRSLGTPERSPHAPGVSPSSSPNPSTYPPRSRTANSLILVDPATVVGWHRRGSRAYWRWTSRPKEVGPRIDPSVRRLIAHMWSSNMTWGALRIQAELHKLGIDVSDSTVRRYRPTWPRQPSQNWRAFLEKHLGDIAAMDFFVVPTVTFRVLYVLVIMAHDGPRIGIALDHVVVLNERHLLRVLRSYASYHHASRTHRVLDGDAPGGRAVEPPEKGEVVAYPQVGGLHRRYARRAA